MKKKKENIENQDPNLEKIRHYRGTWDNFFDFWKSKGVEVDPYKGTILKYPTEKVYKGRETVHQDFDTYKKSKTIKENMKHIITFNDFIKESIDEETITERYNKKSLLKKLGKADDAMIQTGNGKEYIIYNPNNNNDDNTAMWGDKTIFALDQDGEEHEIAYKDIGLVMVESTVNEKTSFSQMKKDIKTKEYKEISDAIENAQEVSDIWNMLDPKMFKFTESEFEDIFDEWWNNATRYDSISDFSRNAFMEDVHSLYLHLLPYSK